ncbi:PII uridylyl-transferase [Parvularcula bermudensis HTCC2503]|uniref:Bifunctional uridylyltransferase/uridylyl-removing enzyme n=1 Tax=Parvularcula bermudensis (strain ATCC BAA-594 / HTCC2503 / KCTC 12087) TaxID=314260 RepID=E0TCR0_PARBH|nr:nucleotidyltransferase domain-containing protein [Parvularcula bermudensis]ADM08649.1 PII uridylyl-transferase [Parvularcula bermudensis HTCC2503]
MMDGADIQLRLADELRRTIADGASSSELGRYLANERRRIVDTAFAGGGDGVDIARSISAGTDWILQAMIEAAAVTDCAVFAVGGYGRGRLAPHSDIDLLIITGSDDVSISQLLYPLWDSGLTISQSVHTVRSAIESLKEDPVFHTALLDARPLSPANKLAAQFLDKLKAQTRRRSRALIAAKMQERDERYAANNSSLYTVEPDIKQGRGGLRDLDTLRWFCKALDREACLAELFDDKEQARLDRADRFLWSVRVHLHQICRRADDRLTFSHQPLIADRLGFTARTELLATERFMRSYFLATRAVASLTGYAIDRLAETVDRRRRPIRPRRTVPEPIVWSHKRLDFAEGTVPSVADGLLLFALAAETGCTIHPRALQLLSRTVRSITFAETVEETLADRFVAIIRSAKRLGPLLSQMAECGLLGLMMPGFGGVIGKVEYGLYRRFTLDDHVLRSIYALDELIEGTLKGVETMPFADKARELRVEICMALLLQEAEAAMPGLGVEALRQRLTRRVGLFTHDSQTGEDVAFCVVNRMMLIRSARRRNIMDIEVIERLSHQVGTLQRLMILSLVTFCRQRVVGLGSWEDFARRDIGVLIDLVRLQIEGGEGEVERYLNRYSEKLRGRVQRLIDADGAAALDHLIEAVGASLWVYADVPAIADLATLFAGIISGKEHVGLHIDPGTEGLLDIVVVSTDRPTLFAECTGAASVIGGSVFSACGFSVDLAGRRVAVILLQLQRVGNLSLEFVPGPEEKARIEELFSAIAEDRCPDIALPSPSIDDRRHVFDVETQVRIDDTASSKALVVEVETRDRPGLLHLLAVSLAEIGVDIEFALVATYGHRAVDTFYLQDAPGYKIEDPRRIEAIKRGLLRALDD